MDRRVTAVLGPTNTGKTYLAMDRLLGHASGMIGFPLRLLARENYDRAVAIKGADKVALITGEEKIIPPGARYFMCTVESMPVDRDVAFFCVDEIQLAADRERGHVFTERLLHGRGQIETMFLGAETIRPLIRQLVPEAQFETRRRFSKLTYGGPKKLTRLPRRTAVVAFSASEVYGIADLIRRQRGGTAVVMGALSPRTRNAQVALYQSGEVDYLVATDAIGMGLNMDVDHVAFASLSKFDGRSPRNLTAPELAQIGGRAGRHMNDGTFGTTADSPPLDPEIIARIESHEFPPLKTLFWRNTDLQFATVASLISGLKKRPPKQMLSRPPQTEDQLTLELLAKDPDVLDRAKGAERVRILWDVAQVPDFRKLRSESHSRLLQQVYLHLTETTGLVPQDWVSDQVKRLDRHDGDIHTLMDRIAAIRIWTYLANRPGWVENAREWQGQTRAVEDRLSDSLHDKLTQQFIDKRTAHLVKKLKSDEKVIASVDDAGRAQVDGHFIGHMEGLVFKADKTGLKAADKAVANAANAAIVPELGRRVQEQIDSAPADFSIDDQGRILWKDAVIAVLVAGPEILKPELNLKADERLEVADRDRLLSHLKSWVQSHVARVLPSLVIAADSSLTGAARGLAYRVVEDLGSTGRADAEAQIKSLSEEDRKAVSRLGIRFGIRFVYVPATLKAEPIRLRGILWNVFSNSGDACVLPPAGRVSFETDESAPAAFYQACGFFPVRGTAYRVDMVERFSSEVRRLLREKVSILPPEQLSPLGIDAEKAVGLLKVLGYIASITPEGITIAPKKHQKKPASKTAQTRQDVRKGADNAGGEGKSQDRSKRKGPNKNVNKHSKRNPKKPANKFQGKKKPTATYDPDSPFAKLKDLIAS